MNLEHLGDALDHWKGGVIELLRDSLRDLHVVPMFTDNDPAVWNETRLKLYVRLMRVPRERIVGCDQPYHTRERHKYFAGLNLPATADVFVDPDIGISSASCGTCRHIRMDDLDRILGDSQRVVLAYQHVHRILDSVNQSLGRVVESLKGTSAFAYNVGPAAILFISRAEARLSDLHNQLSDWFAGLKRITAILP